MKYKKIQDERKNSICQDKEAERKSWVVDEIKKFGIHDPYGDRLYYQVIERILRIIGEKEKLKIIDLGCGSSAYGIRLAKRGHTVTGVDISEEAVESAKLRAKQEKVNARFYTQDIEQLEFKDNTYDLCIFGGVLHHFPSLEIVFKESMRVLRPGGYIVFIEPNKQNPHVYLTMELRSRFRYRHLTPNERSIHYKEAVKLLGHKLSSYQVFYKLMTLSDKGRHIKPSFFAKLFYNLGGFAIKNVRGNLFNRIVAAAVYDAVHVYQRFAPAKRYGNFVIFVGKIRK